MSRVSITVAGRAYAVRLALWVAANDCHYRFVSVDLLAPTP
ncbi:hypothetical protein OKC48_23750 [Methylorubrum extorquens]|nr:hypothetical protein [Methylorubrum extorquens]UYW26247.1 hypothetical protein OKC48_23750 [Methylorubrum extorquens]